MKVSVVMATYNGSKYINQQLESLRDQSKKIDEVRIYDDGSSDNTIAIVERFIADNDIDDSWVIKMNESSKGAYLNFIEGSLECSGDIIFFCDQDDFWELDKVEKMVSGFEKHDDMLACYCLERYVDAQGNEIKHSFQFTHNVKAEQAEFKKVSLNQNIKYNKCPGLCLAVKRELLEEVAPFIIKYNLMHDLPFGNVAALKGGFYVLNEKLVNYRQHSSNLSAPKLTMMSRFKNIDYQIRGRKGRYRQMNAFYQEYKEEMDAETKSNLRKEVIKIQKSIEYLERRKIIPLFFQIWDGNPMDNRWIAINNLMCALCAGKKNG